MTASSAPATSYKDTLNLLQTPFSMRANAKVREPEIQAFWAELQLYERLSQQNSGESFTLHDGPPYANGALHVGHALNKILKDIINKTALLQGKRARFIPGWDCHGLPIELKVLQGLKSSERAELTPVSLRQKAHAYALEQVEGQKAGFRRWGIWADWDQPYLTLQKSYEAGQIGVFGAMVLAGHIYRGLKPVHWSPSSRTALAEAELEYPDGHTSPSVYAAFPAVELPEALAGRLSAAGLSSDAATAAGGLAVAIWTTTPWTLPANLAVSVNERLDYTICAVAPQGDNSAPGVSHLVVAAELRESLETSLGLTLKPLLSVKGADLAGIVYRHPLLERTSQVVIGGDYITTEAGTGLVHTAPGHGVDDFNTGKKYGLPVLCPVDEAGNLTAEAGPFAGTNVLKDANPTILEALEGTGLLLKQERYEHRYPYDWRTKKPTIFRATEQWFASVEGFRAAALDAIAQVEWLPASGRNRIEAMVSERGDWCISRQRTWGVPIPVFYHRETGEVLLNQTTLDHIQALIAEHGSDVWWQRDEAGLLPEPYAADAAQWRKGTDTMDVWFDSGSSWAGVLGGIAGSESRAPELHYPADLYLEGSDQHRGWFQSSLLTSVAVNGHAPYKRVLTHGFTLDEKGRKMSKSLGNVVDPAVLVEGGKNEKQEPAYGADVLRLWVSSVDYSADVPLGPGIVKQLADVYRKVRNTARYLLGNLHDFNPATDAVPYAELPLLDQWMLQRTAALIDSVTGDFERFEFYRFFQALQNFCVVDLSNVYLDIAKDRLYVSGAADFRRRSCQTVLALVVERLAGLIAPVLCHMAEDIWQNLPYAVAERSVFERGWPTAPAEWHQPALEQPMEQILHLRALVNRQLESCRSSGQLGASLEAQVQLELGDGAESTRTALAWLEATAHPSVDNLADWLLVSALRQGGVAPAEVLAEASESGLSVRIAKAAGEKCERCWHYASDIGQHNAHPTLCGRCVTVLS
ncbi:isoleucine--tRNA ligase [Synechococcus sp. LA31]|uniref:isoleucine--tRNA ligase n=1 Tax=Synechococcus sp. LA31 TaxID=2741953 RepID=UPI001BDD8F71|nr:isoleucine--tRNA ligase [Synechococcus sp. LA31]QVV66852.1 isoleucine--tRNA ligase [Synechococcus sp. LA31]